MDKKRSAFAAPDAGRMTDAELSKRLGGLQRRSAAWLLVGLIGAVSGTVCFFTVQAALLRAILVTVLFFGGVCCAVVFGGGAQKKLKALMHEQLGDFFRSEWEITFGPDIHTPEMRIDEPFMKALHLLDGEWETCSVDLRDLDAVRRSYVRLLQEMCCVLDRLKASPALTGAAE